MHIDDPTLQAQSIQITVQPMRNAALMSVVGGMQELRHPLTVLSRRQVETASPENRLVGEFQTTIRILAEQQEPPKQRVRVIHHRQDQITSHQEWIARRQAVQEEEVTYGRLFQDKIREEMAERSQEAIKVGFARHQASASRHEAHQILDDRHQETAQAAKG